MSLNKKPLTLTIVIPVLNEERYIKRCLQSIADQTVVPYEVIVVDNGSTDNTVDIARKYSFVTVVTEKRKGIVFARNKGYNTAKADIIARTDADVILPKNWVESILRFYDNPENLDSAITGGGYPLNLRFPKVCFWILSLIAFRYNALLIGHYLVFGSNMAFPKKHWLAVKDEVCKELGIHEDLDLSIHLNSQGFRIHYDKRLRVWGYVRRGRENREKLLGNLLYWPRTLYKHGHVTWVFGLLGALLIYIFSPLPIIFEHIARFFGRKPLQY